MVELLYQVVLRLSKSSDDKLSQIRLEGQSSRAHSDGGYYRHHFLIMVVIIYR